MRPPRLKNPPLLMSPGPPTATERPWESSPGPERGAEGSPVPVATRARSGAAASGTGWQTRAGSPGPKGRGQLLATAGARPCGPAPSPISSSRARRTEAAHSAPGRSTAERTPPGRRGECTAQGPFACGARPGPEGVALVTTLVPLLGFLGLSRRPLGRGKPATSGLDAGPGMGVCVGRPESPGLAPSQPRHCKFHYLTPASRQDEARRAVHRV